MSGPCSRSSATTVSATWIIGACDVGGAEASSVPEPTIQMGAPARARESWFWSLRRIMDGCATSQEHISTTQALQGFHRIVLEPVMTPVHRSTSPCLCSSRSKYDDKPAAEARDHISWVFPRPGSRRPARVGSMRRIGLRHVLVSFWLSCTYYVLRQRRGGKSKLPPSSDVSTRAAKG